MRPLSDERTKNNKTITAIINQKRFIGGTTLVGLLGLWAFLTEVIAPNRLAYPSPQKLWDAFTEIAVHGYTGSSLVAQIGTSLEQTMEGFIAAVVLGVTVGLWAGYNKKVGASILPVVNFIRPIPPISLVTLFVFYFGIGNTSKVVLIFLTGFWYMILTVSDGIENLSKDWLRVGESMGLTQSQKFRHIIVPGTMPSIVTGTRIALGLAWALVVAAELVAAHEGLGYMIENATQFFQISTVYVVIIIIGILGFLLDKAIQLVGRRVLHWQGM